jgi:antitoxin (DNA-binding transcriptional repressor) of toxin-antitoxin stability system
MMPLTLFRDSVSECVKEAQSSGEKIAITRHGEVVAYLVPAGAPIADLKSHPMFGSLRDDPRSPEEILASIRAPRHDL